MILTQLRIFLIVGLLSGLSPLVAQPICEPDTTLDSLGVFPSVPPAATVGTPYEVTLNAAVPEELEVGITLDICEARITGTRPDTNALGLTFECNVPDCEIQIDHSDDNPFSFACIVLSGVPDTVLDSVEVLFRVGLGTYNASTNTCMANISLDTSLVVALQINADTSTTTGLAGELPGATMTSSFDPGQEQLAVELDLQNPGAYRLEALDLQGRVMDTYLLGAGPHLLHLNTSPWPSGLYLLRLRSAAGLMTQKVLLRR